MGSVDLLLAYAAQVNEQIERSRQHLRENVREEWHESSDLENPEFPVRAYGDMYDLTWDLNEIFEDYFPALQRSAAVVTIYAVFERELMRLCALVQKSRGFRAGVKNMHGTGIEQAVDYLDLVCNVEPCRESMEFCELRHIQRVRGALAHGSWVNPAQNGKFGRLSGIRNTWN